VIEIKPLAVPDAYITVEALQKLADAVQFDEPKLAPMFDWKNKESADIIVDALSDAASEIERLTMVIGMLSIEGISGMAKRVEELEKHVEELKEDLNPAPNWNAP
jgi:hypothetical protein